MTNNADIELLAGLNIDSSEQEIIKAIKVLQSRIQNNNSAKIKVNAQIDESDITKTLEKLQKILKNKNLSIDTKNSIVGIQQEASAMLDVVSSANKAAKEKLGFANANKKVEESANNTSRAIDRERNAMRSMENIDYILNNINIQGRNGNSVFQQFGSTLRDAFYAYSAANLLQDAIYKVIAGGKEAVETVKELNDAATSLRMATGESSEYVKQLMSSYNSLGQEIGAITTDVAESADEWLRQGHSINDTNELIRDSMVLSKVSNLNSADSTKYLTSAMQGYKVSVENVLGIVDKLSAVDLESATDAGGLAEAMSRTAEGAQIAGISMDRLLGMLATVGEVTQKSMSSIGESYKTVFSRMRDIKDDKLSVVGDDGEIEDLSNVEIVLNSLGIKLRESNQEFRNFQTVLDDVAASWDGYSSVQKAAIAKAFSGVRQQENFLVMMENWDKVQKYTKIAENSNGTAEEKFGYYLESLEAKTNSLKASLEKLASTTISDELYGSILDVTKGLVDATTESGILKGALAGLGTAGAVFAFEHLASYLHNAVQEFSNLSAAMEITRNGTIAIDEMEGLIELTNGLSSSQTRLLLSTTNLTDAQKIAILMGQGMSQEEAALQIQTWGVAAAQTGATQATITLSGALRGLWATLMANPLVLVTTVVTVGVMAWNKYKQAQEEAGKALDESLSNYESFESEMDSLNKELKTTQTRMAELQKLADNGTISVVEQEELNTLKETNEELERKVRLKQEEKQLEAKEGLDDADVVITEKENGKFYDNGKKVTQPEALKNAISKTEEAQANIDEINKKYDSGEIDAESYKIQIKGEESVITGARKRAKEVYEKINNAKKQYENAINSGVELSPEQQKNYETAKKSIALYDKFLIKIQETTHATNENTNATDTNTTSKENNNNAVTKSTQSSSTDKLSAQKTKIEELRKEYQDVLNQSDGKTDTSAIDAILNKIDKAKSKLASLKSQEFTNAWSALENTDNDELKDAKKDLTDLADAGKLTVDEFKHIPGVEDYFKEIGLSAEEAVKKINDLTDNTKQLSTLKSAIGSIQDAYSEKKENGIVGADTLSKMETEFGSLGKAWDTYKQKAGSAKTSTAELKKAQNELATAYVNSNNFLSGLVSETGKCTEANKQYYISQLEELGIKNAEEVVNNEIIRQKANLIIENINLGTATKEEIDWLDAEINKLGLSKKALQQYRFYKQIASNTALDTSASVKNLIELAKKCGVAEKAIKRLQILLSTLNQIDYNKQLLEDSVIKSNPHASESIRKNIEEYNRIVKNIKKKSKKDALDYVDKVLTDDDTDLTIDPSNGNDKNSKDKSTKSKQTFDWIEKRLDHLANKTQKTIDKINNYIKQGTKNKYYTTLLNNIDDEIKANDKAAKKYQQKANTVTFSKNKAKDKAFKKKIRTGAIDGSYKQLIQNYGEKTATKIENYRNWYDKSENAKKTASQKRQEKREKTREALDSRIEDLNNQLDQIKNTADGYQHKIDLQEANGLSATKNDYNNLINNSKTQISNLEAQNKELAKYQKGLKKNSVEWYDIQKQINDNNSSIQDLTKSQAEWNAEIRKLPLNVIQSMIDLLDSAKSSFESLLNLKKQINKHISSKDVEKQINFEKENMQLSTSKIQELAKGDLNKALSEEGLNKSQKQLYANYLRQLGEGEIGEKQFFELINKLGISKEDYNRNTLLKDTTQSMLSEYSSWLESANNIDQTAESYIDTQIDKLQEERDLLKEINDAKSKALELEKKQQKLQEAKQNKTNLIYHEGVGFNYEADRSAVNDAQNELDDYNFELNQDQYDEAIKVLEEIRDKESYVTLDQDGNVLTPDWDNWVKKIVDSLNSKNFTFNLVQDSAGNITTAPKYAKGTMSAKGGMSIVGENGIEMRLLNQGDAILPHDVTENLWDFGLNPQQMIMDNLKLPDYSGLIKPRAVEQNKVVHIQNVTLPNINDLSKAQELFDGLMTINSDATQRAWKH